jgi:hypothetical protein
MEKKRKKKKNNGKKQNQSKKKLKTAKKGKEKPKRRIKKRTKQKYNMKKIMTALAGLILLSVLVNGLSFDVTRKTMAVQIATEGKDNVTEKFYLYFPNETEKVAFREKSLELGTNLDAWKQLNPEFIPNIQENTLNKRIAYTEGEESILQIDYELAEPLMNKTKETTTMEEYEIKVNYFNSFYNTGQWIIPENTTVSIELPPGAEIKGTIEPEATTSTTGNRKTITWQGYKSKNELRLSYTQWKKSEPLIDLNKMRTYLFETTEGITITAIITIIVLAIIWQRKKITNTIENFVEENSTIKEE